MMAALAVVLVTLHMVDGRPAIINPLEITQLIQPHEDGEGNKLLVDAVHCVITFTNGKYVSVAETCEEVIEKVGAGK